jgi:hypothetical protein
MIITNFSYKQSITNSVKTAIIILKLIIPISILSNIISFYNLLSYFTFLIEPFTQTLNLPLQSSLALLSGMFLNLYAAIAFAYTLDLSPYQWSILAIFLGICHSLIIEGAIMKKIGISLTYSYLLRIICAFCIAYLTTFIPNEYFSSISIENTFIQPHYTNITTLLIDSFYNSLILSIKIIALMSVLIVAMDFIKTRKFIQKQQKHISKNYSIMVGLFLGITYGSGVLIKELKSGSMSKQDVFYISTFLLICHAIIEDTLLFVIFGADFTMVVTIRVIFAIIIAYAMGKIYFKITK